jgi:hypothetical protein
MARGRGARHRGGAPAARGWLQLGATFALLALVPGQVERPPREPAGGASPSPSPSPEDGLVRLVDLGVGHCERHDITAYADLPPNKQDVVQQCIPMGHAGVKVICKSLGKDGLVRLADEADFYWDINPETDCDTEAMSSEDELDLHEWTAGECPPIRPPDELLEEAACEDEAHSHLPKKERDEHIACVQACMFALQAKCTGVGEDAPRGPLTLNQSTAITTGVASMIKHCRIAAVHGHDAYIWLPPIFGTFYVIAVLFFVYVYQKCLRANPERKFTLAKAKGEIAHHEQAVLRRTPLWEKYGQQANLFFMADLDDPANIKELGMDAAMYLTHMRMCGQFCIVQYFTLGMILSCVYLLAHSHSEVHQDNWMQIMQSYSYAGLSESPQMQKYLWVVPFGAAWQSLSLIYFVVRRQKKLNKVKLASGFSEVRSTTTLWFEDVPSDLEDKVIKRWFDQAVPGKVAEVQVARDVHDLAKNIREQRRLITKINTLNADVAANRAGEEGTGKLDFARVAEEINQSRIRLVELEQAEDPLRRTEFPGSGNIFVTFVDEMSALEFRAEHTMGKYTSNELQIETWQCTQAPMPAELYWDNMGMTPWQRRFSTLKGYFLTACAFGAFCFMAGIAIFFLAWDYFGLLYSLYPVPSMDIIITDVRQKLSLPVYYGVCGLGFLVAVLAFEEHMAHIVAVFSGYERKVTKSRVQSSYLMKAYIFYLIFHVGLSAIVFYIMTYTWLETDTPRKYTVDMWGLFHMHRACLTFGVVDPMHLFEGAKFFRRKSVEVPTEHRSKILSAEDEDELDEEHDDFYSTHFDFSKNYGETLAIFTSCNAWTLMHPIMLPCGALYFYAKLYIDMYQITRQYSRPAIQYSGRAKSTTHIMLMSLVVTNFINWWYFKEMEPNSTMETWFYFIIAFNIIAMKLHSQGKDILPKVIRTKMKRGHQRKLQTSDWAQSDSPTEGEDAAEVDFTYSPPSPETMQVGVRLETGDRANGYDDDPPPPPHHHPHTPTHTASLLRVAVLSPSPFGPPCCAHPLARPSLYALLLFCSTLEPRLPRSQASREGSPRSAGCVSLALAHAPPTQRGGAGAFLLACDKRRI